MTSAAEGFSDPQANHGAWRWDLVTQKIEWSAAVYRLHGVSPSTFKAEMGNVRELVHPDDLERYSASIRAAIDSHSPFTIQHRIIRPDGSVRTLVVRGAFLPGTDGGNDALVGTTEDITERERADDRLWHLANHDSLTSLFNRRRLLEELEREIAVS